jgi:hypothetical protein
MKKALFFLAVLFIYGTAAFSQTITEKEIFDAGSGAADAYSLYKDSLTGKYYYISYNPDEGKYSIIMPNGKILKYEYVNPESVRFDRNDNYYTITSTYDTVTQVSTYFLVSNDKTVKTFGFADQNSAYINPNGEYEFIYMEPDSTYRIGRYTTSGGFKESEKYELLKPIYSTASAQTEHERPSYFTDRNGNRGYVGIKNGKASIIFGSNVMQTNYSDINEYSFVRDNNGDIAYSARRNGKMYDYPQSEFVVAGGKEYKEYGQILGPIMFTKSNVPVYAAGTPIDSFTFKYNLVSGNDVQQVKSADGKRGGDYTGGISDIKIDDAGNLSYIAMMSESIEGFKPEDTKFYQKVTYVKNGVESKYYVNRNYDKKGPNGQLLYTAMKDPFKDKYTLFVSDASGERAVTEKNYDMIADYGFTGNGGIYYVAQEFGNYDKNIPDKYTVFIDGKKVGTYETLLSEGENNEASILKFNGMRYAFAAQDKKGADKYTSYIVSEKGRVKPPMEFDGIEHLMYLKNGKLFYIGSNFTNTSASYRLLADNKILDKTYTSINDLKYDQARDEMTFRGTRGSKIYDVSVKF